MKSIATPPTRAQSEAALKLALAEHHAGSPYATRLRQEAALLLGKGPTWPSDQGDKPTKPLLPIVSAEQYLSDRERV